MGTTEAVVQSHNNEIKTTTNNKVAPKSVQFDTSLDWDAEDLKTDRGFKLRRLLRDRKRVRERNRQAKIDATLQLLQDAQHDKSLADIVRRNSTVRGLLDCTLNIFVPPGVDIATRLMVFRNLKLRRVLTSDEKLIILSLFGNTTFYHDFLAYFPMAVVIAAFQYNDNDWINRRRIRRQLRIEEEKRQEDEKGQVSDDA